MKVKFNYVLGFETKGLTSFQKGFYKTFSENKILLVIIWKCKIGESYDQGGWAHRFRFYSRYFQCKIFQMVLCMKTSNSRYRTRRDRRGRVVKI